MIEKNLAVAPSNTARENWPRLLIVVIATILITLPSLPALAQKPLPVELVVATKANAYQGPGEDYRILAIYSQGITLTVSGRTFDRNWLQVAITDYNTAWMPAEAFFDAPALEELPLAATPAGLVTVTPDPGPPLILEVKLVLNPWTKAQVFEVKIHSRQPHTRITIFLNDSQGRNIVRFARSTDSQGDLTSMFGSGLVTDGTYTVVVTDSYGNTIQRSATVTGWHKPTPTP